MRCPLRLPENAIFSVSLTLVAMLLLTPIGNNARSTGADEPSPASTLPASPRLEFSLLDTAGTTHSLRTNPDRAALALVFLATECPIANGYIPELNRQFTALHGSGTRVDFFGVI